MKKKIEMSWSSTQLFLKLFLISILLQSSLGISIYEDDKRQGLIPLARLGGARIVTALDDPKHGNTIIYPRLGRRIWELHQTLIPYPRAGRVVVDPESLDYDVFFNAEPAPGSLDDTLTESFLSNQPIVKKRPNVKLIPRIGRKKRSVLEEYDEVEPNFSDSDQDLFRDESDESLWEDIRESQTDVSSKENKTLTDLKADLDKKRSEEEYDIYDDKRAAAFTPRIGRAALIPRIGRNDARFRLKSRAFIPRIGRRASFVPRIGRSENSQNENKHIH